MQPFLKFRDEQDALSLKFLRPSVKKLLVNAYFLGTCTNSPNYNLVMQLSR